MATRRLKNRKCCRNRINIDTGAFATGQPEFVALDKGGHRFLETATKTMPSGPFALLLFIVAIVIAACRHAFLPKPCDRVGTAREPCVADILFLDLRNSCYCGNGKP